MVTGFHSANIDFDDLFEPYVSGNRSPLSGYRIGNVDLNQRFQALGGASKRADVGYSAGGVDLANFWLPKGSSGGALGFNGKAYAATAQSPTGASAAPNSRLSLNINADGSWQIVRTVSNSTGGNGTTTVESGTWLPAGQSSGEWVVQFSVNSSTGGGVVTNGAPTPQPCNVSRSIALSATVPAATSDFMQANMGLTCSMSRAAGGSTVSTCNFQCIATGWL